MESGATKFEEAWKKILDANQESSKVNASTVETMVNSFSDAFGGWAKQIQAFKDSGGTLTDEGCSVQNLHGGNDTFLGNETTYQRSDDLPFA